MIDLDELKRLAEAATPGPWTWGAQFVCVRPTVLRRRYVDIAQCPNGEYDSPKWNTNAAYIAAMSPDTAIALIERLERAEAALREIETYVEQLGSTVTHDTYDDRRRANRALTQVAGIAHNALATLEAK